MISALAFVLLLGPSQDEAALSAREYRDRVAGIGAALKGGDLPRARAEAKALSTRRIRHGGKAFDADAALMASVAGAPDLVAARALTPRIAALVDGLDALGLEEEPSKPDPGLLDRLRQKQASDEIAAGGRVGGPQLHDPRIPVPPSVLERIMDALRWAGEKISDFFTWLWKLFFGERERGGPGGGTSALTAILVFLLVAGLGLVAFLAWRRKRASPAAAVALSAAPAGSGSDEDPLSRTAGEWERFGAELLRAGRYREAIRAWYHALLVTLFRAGALHYRKDRTNWEYAYALPPSTAWRPAFVDATRRFEFEWYGRRETGAETAAEFTRQAQSILSAVRGGADRG